MIRNWPLPRFFAVVVEAEEDAIGVLNIGDPMSVSRGPHVLFHELMKLRILFQCGDGLPVDPELSRRGRDAEFLESLERLRHALHTDLKVIERLRYRTRLRGKITGPIIRILFDG